MAHKATVMATLFLHTAGHIAALACPADAPLLLAADGRIVAADWAFALAPFAIAPRAPRRFALIVAPGAAVAIGAIPVHAGVTELHDGDHLFFGDCEAIFSTDTVPAPVRDAEGPCPVCREALDAGGRRGLFRCERCGLQACNTCWSLAPRSVCLTPACGQPAALERPLWAPEPDAFISYAGAS